jgi:endonuclease/exonuclease/phosphatase family metal-dependent hydrolase
LGRESRFNDLYGNKKYEKDQRDLKDSKRVGYDGVEIPILDAGDADHYRVLGRVIVEQGRLGSHRAPFFLEAIAVHCRRMRTPHRLVAILALILAASCRTGRDYASALGPRHAGGPPIAVDTTSSRPTSLRVVSFNIAFARHIDGAIELLSSEPALRRADIVLLQEMDASGTQRIASALGMWYVYYPAIFHNRTRRDFGNAVLSRWPIVDDAKLVLPHPSRYAGTHRVATAATVLVGASRVRVYSTHLGTLMDIGAERRRDQLRAILADAATHPLVVIGGDLNSASIGRLAEEAGYTWPTRNGARTTHFGRWDHLFFKGLKTPDADAAGTVLHARGVSDHRPIWALGILPY